MTVLDMTLTLGYRKKTDGKLHIHGTALPVIAMTCALGYSSILGNLVSYSANQDLTVHAYELSKADVQEAAYALPAEPEVNAVTILDGRFPSAYINDETSLLANGKILSASIGTADKRSKVYMMEEGSEYTLVLMEDGSSGFVRNGTLTSSLANIFDDADAAKWIAEEGVSILAAPSEGAEVIASPAFNDEVRLIGTNDLTYWKVRYGDTVGYIDHSKMMDEMYVEPEPEPEPEPVQPVQNAAPMANPAWDGSVLTVS